MAKDLARSGMTMLVVMHALGFAREAGDKVAFMDAGAIIEQGDPRTVLSARKEKRLQDFLSNSRAMK